MSAQDNTKLADVGVVLLALDGGQTGTTELSMLIILREILRRIAYDKNLPNEPLPSELVDLIGGSGMGGLIAILLGPLRMSIDDAINAYYILYSRVFSSDAWSGKDLDAIADLMDAAVEEVFSMAGRKISDPLLQSATDNCKTFICTLNPVNVSTPRLLRTYRSRSNQGPNCSIRDALFASIADHTHLRSVSLGTSPLTETLVGASHQFNNPTEQLIREARSIFQGTRGIACILSLGVGHPGPVSFPLSAAPDYDSLVKISQGSERRADEFGRACANFPDLFFRLSVEQGLQVPHDLKALESVTAHTSHYCDLDQISRNLDRLLDVLNKRPALVPPGDLVSVRNSAAAQESKALLKRALPPRTALLIGREEELAALVKSVLAFKSSVILGLGGIGKTSLAVAVLHDKQVQQRFPSRFFVNCEGITTLDLLYADLADWCGISASQREATRLREQVLFALQSEQTIVCFDNFETLWDVTETRYMVEQALADFTNIAEVSVLVTMRGSKEPGVVLWDHPLTSALKTLSFDDAMDLFQRHSGCQKDDEYATKLVEAVEAVPLAVELLAYQARGDEESTEELWLRWLKQGTRAVSRAPEGRLMDLDSSIELSLNSPRLQRTPTAKSTLVLLSLLPSGLDKKGYIYEWLEKNQKNEIEFQNSLTALTSTALAFIDSTSGRRCCRVLAPISRYAVDNLRDIDNHKSQLLLIRSYITFLSERSPHEPKQHKFVPHELTNSHSVLKFALHEGLADSDEFVSAIIGLTQWMEFVSAPSDDLLVATLELKDMSPAVKRDCLLGLGETYLRQDRLGEAEASFLQAAELHRKAHDSLGKGTDRMRLGEVYLRQDRLEEAEASFLQAVKLQQKAHNALGELLFGMRLGEVYLRQDRLEEAEASLLQGIGLRRIVHDDLGGGTATTWLAKVYLRQDRLEEAEASLLQAVMLHQKAQDALGEGTDRTLLGEVYLRQDRLDEAEASLLQAVELHQKAHSALSEGADRTRLGEVYLRQDRLEEAEESLLQAVELHQKCHSALSEGTDRMRLGEVYLRQDRLEEAEESLLQAVELHQKCHSAVSEGTDRMRLGEVYLRHNQVDKAEASLLQAVMLHQKAQDALSEGTDRMRLAQVYLRRDRLGEAETSLLQAVELHQKAHCALGEGSARMRLGAVYLRQDRLEEAEASLVQAGVLHRKAHSTSCEHYDRQLLGSVYFQQGRLNKAEASLLQAVKLNKDARAEGSDRLILGEIYFYQDRLEEAEASVCQAIDFHKQSQSKDGLTLDNFLLGRINIKFGRFENAKEALDAAVSLAKESQLPTFEAHARFLLDELGKMGET